MVATQNCCARILFFNKKNGLLVMLQVMLRFKIKKLLKNQETLQPQPHKIINNLISQRFVEWAAFD